MASRSYTANYSGSGGNYITLRLDIYTIAKDIIGNTSTERADLWAEVNNSSYGYYNYTGAETYIGINGNNTNQKIPFDFKTTGNKLLIGTWDTTIQHDSNGNATIGISAHHYSGVLLGNASITGTYTCDRIDRAASINSFSGNDINSSFNVTYSTFNNSFNHKLRISIPNSVSIQTIENYISGTSFMLSENAKSEIYSKTATSQYIQIESVIETWSGDTKIGESSNIINNCLISNSSPSFDTATYKDTNSTTTDMTKNNQIIVEDVSTIQFDIPNIVAKNNAKLVKLEVLLKGKTKVVNLSGTNTNISVDFGTATYDATQSDDATITLTDSRGFTFVQKLPIIFNGYYPLYVTEYSFKRKSQTSGELELVLKGKYFYGKIGVIDYTTSQGNPNTANIKVKFRESGSSTQWEDIQSYNLPTISNAGNFYFDENTPSVINSFDFDYKKAYEFKFEISDLLTKVEINSKDITKGIPVFDYGEDDFRVNGSLRKRNIKTNGESITGEVYGGAVLYNSETGSSGAITLSDTSVNYTFFDIYFKNNDDIYSFTRVYNPNGKKVELLCTSAFTNALYLKGRTISIDEENITTADTNTYTETYIMNGSYNVAGNNQIYITTVIGYI